jgi:hypothetical protein
MQPRFVAVKARKFMAATQRRKGRDEHCSIGGIAPHTVEGKRPQKAAIAMKIPQSIRSVQTQTTQQLQTLGTRKPLKWTKRMP